MTTLRENAKRYLKHRARNAETSWIELIKPIARELNRCFPDRTHEILGPFGLGATTSVLFWKPGTKDLKLSEKYAGDNCLSISFRPGNLSKGELFVVDYDTNTREFRPGTIGEVNGFNHPNIELDPYMEIRELRQYVK